MTKLAHVGRLVLERDAVPDLEPQDRDGSATPGRNSIGREALITTMRKFLHLLAAAALVAPAPAFACTICHSPTAWGVRHLLLEHDVLHHLAAISAPLAVLLAIIAIIAREPRTEV